MLKIIPVVALLFAAAPALAQSGSTQSPPAPNSASSGPEPANSLPPGAANMNTGTSANPNAAGIVGTTAVTPTGIAPGALATTPGTTTSQQPMANTVPAPASK